VIWFAMPELPRHKRRAVIKVHAQPVIEPHHKSGWELVLWTGDAFDRSTPFRQILAEIASVLNDEAPSSVELPGYDVMEDEVEGVLRFGDERVRIYYEYTLSYLSLMSDDANALRKVADRLQPLVALAA
jgi:hypothetical protein